MNMARGGTDSPAATAAAGSRGSNIDYLAGAVAQLERMGIDPGGLRPLLRRALEFEAAEVSSCGKTR